MIGVTYELTVQGMGSAQYYRNVAAFTEKVISYGETLADSLLDQFQLFSAATAPETPRTPEECLLELLVLGTYWRIYGRTAWVAPKFKLYLLSALTTIRQRNNCFKSIADLGRGILLTSSLTGETYCSPPQFNNSKKFAQKTNFLTGNRRRSDSEAIPAPTVDHLKKLLRWLKATGEFNQEVKRLHSWLDYLIRQTPAAASGAIHQAIRFASWFENASLTELGQYTGNVATFLAVKRPQRRFREDYLFCGRQRVEYHLNMVGAEILNRAFRADFLGKKRRALILPSCMRNHPGNECRAFKGLLGLECRGCAPSCRVNRLTRVGAANHFEVYIIPHESSLFAAGMAQPGIKENLGIIGVACVLNLLGGGWKVQEMGLPPQCVLLNCCGCKKHWLDQDTAPDLDMHRLLEILDNGGGKSECLAKFGN